MWEVRDADCAPDFVCGPIVSGPMAIKVFWGKRRSKVEKTTRVHNPILNISHANEVVPKITISYWNFSCAFFVWLLALAQLFEDWKCYIKRGTREEPKTVPDAAYGLENERTRQGFLFPGARFTIVDQSHLFFSSSSSPWLWPREHLPFQPPTIYPRLWS